MRRYAVRLTRTGRQPAYVRRELAQTRVLTSWHRQPYDAGASGTWSRGGGETQGTGEERPDASSCPQHPHPLPTHTTPACGHVGSPVISVVTRRGRSDVDAGATPVRTDRARVVPCESMPAQVASRSIPTGPSPGSHDVAWRSPGQRARSSGISPTGSLLSRVRQGRGAIGPRSGSSGERARHSRCSWSIRLSGRAASPPPGAWCYVMRARWRWTSRACAWTSSERARSAVACPGSTIETQPRSAQTGCGMTRSTSVSSHVA